MPRTSNTDEKWQIIRNRHEDNKRSLKSHNLLPLTIIVTQTIARCKDLAEELKAFLIEQGIDSATADEQVLVVFNNAPDVLKLPYVDHSNNKCEWIVAVSMLNEGWDVKRVFQIVPHEERAFNSKLLIAQVLGRGLRVPDDWRGQQPEVTVFNHDAWAPRIRHLVNEILEYEKRLASKVLEVSSHHFELNNIKYSLDKTVVETPMESEYRLFTKGFVDLASQADTEDIIIDYEQAITGEVFQWQTQIRRKTYTPDEIARVLYERLEEADNSEDTPPTKYTNIWSEEKLKEMIDESLSKIGVQEATEIMRQTFLQALGTLRRKSSTNVRYTPVIDQHLIIPTMDRQAESVGASELRRSKTVFFTDQTRESLTDEQVDFFDDVAEPGSHYSAVKISNRYNFKTPLNLVIADSSNERKFINMLVDSNCLPHYDSWIKSTAIRFYEIDFAWKKRNRPKRGKFSPDFFIKSDTIIIVVEVKGDEELNEPSEENRKKNEYALAHFDRVNQNLEEQGSNIQYKFTFLTPRSFNTFFQYLRDGQIMNFRSELDIALITNGEGS